MTIASYSPSDILFETMSARLALQEAGLNEMSDVLSRAQSALQMYVRESEAFALKYAHDQNFRDRASPRLLFFMGIT